MKQELKSSQVPEVDNTANDAIDIAPEESPKPNRSRRGTLVLTSILALVMVAVAGYAIYLQQRPQQTDVSSQLASKASKQFPPNYCFVRLSKLVCINQAGSRVRYDLPTTNGKVIKTMIPSPDGSQFLAVASKDNTQNSLWILNKYLKVTKEIKLPTGATANGPSWPDGGNAWSHDGKSVLLTIMPQPVYQSPDRQIFRYTLATDTLTQLTKTNENQRPAELADGRVVYWAYTQNTPGQNNGVSEHPMIMNADGSNVKTLSEFSAPGLVQSSDYVSFSQSSNTFYFINQASNQANILSYPGDKIGQNARPSTIPVPRFSSDEYVTQFDDRTLIYQHEFEIDFVDSKTGAIKAKYGQIGTPVGTLTMRGGFALSAAQAEDKYEHILGLSSAPADFQTYIKGEYDKVYAGCAATGADATFIISKVIRDQFAAVGQGCQTGAAAHYAKVNGQWQLAMVLQQEPNCADVNKYAFTKEILPECWDSTKNASIPNPNP